MCLPILFVVPCLAEEPLLPKYELKSDGLTPSAECGKCHRDIYQGWERSLHAHSADNLVFRTAYLQAYFEKGEEARKSCLFCHAPLTLINLDFKLKQGITLEGITCDFCHSIEDVTPQAAEFPYKFQFGRVKQGPSGGIKSPAHSIRENPLFKEARICATCHSLKIENGLNLIETFQEWAEGPYPKQGKPCQECHMPPVAGHRVIPEVKKDTAGTIRDHDVASGHALTKRPKSLELVITDVKRYKKRLAVTVELSNVGAGHKIPTGLPTKRLILEVEVSASENPFRLVEKKIYQKIVVNAKGKPIDSDIDLLLGKGVRVASDNRIAPMETRREHFIFFVPDGQKLTVKASVYYSHNPKIIQAVPISIKLKETRQFIQD